MAEKDIIQNMIYQLGQSQDQRMPAELGIHFADVDERSAEELMLFAGKLAGFVRFYKDDPAVASGDWTAFFPSDIQVIRPLLGNTSPDLTPHLALFLSFLELYRKAPREVINRITGRHLDFYFRDVLRFTPALPVADKAHLVLELKKNSQPILIGPTDLFSAGKDKTKVELIYEPTRQTIINTSAIDSLRSVYYDRSGRGIIRYAPLANSSDGMGKKPEGDEPKWFGFGNEKLPAAEIGFAIASPVLRMKEGERTVTLTLSLDNVDPAVINDESLKGVFEAYISGEKNWLGPYSLTPAIDSNSVLSFNFTVPAAEKAIIDYDPAIHGYRYTSQAPILQLLLKTDDAGLSVGYSDLERIRIRMAKIDVEVNGVTSLLPENDNGSLNPKKPFAPFGQQPGKGSKFLLGYPEALAKNLTGLTLNLLWKNPPSQFKTWYDAYGLNASNDSFSASVTFTYGDDKTYSASGVKLFNSVNAAALQTLSFTPGKTKAAGHRQGISSIIGLMEARTSWSKNKLQELAFRKPISLSQSAVSSPTEGMIAFTLNSSFYQAEYVNKTVENIVNFAKGASGTPATYTALNQPYIPLIQSISLSYWASSGEVNLCSNSLDDFSSGDIRFFHAGCFGQIQEHTYQRSLFGFLPDKSVSLLPAYRNEGELLIGLTELNAGDSVSLLFQLAEGSEDPDLEQVDISWSVLCDNYWKPLSTAEVVLDTTNRLLRSGIISFLIPKEATTANTLMPSRRIWIKGAISKNVKAVCQLITLAANAVEVKFADAGNDPQHLESALEKNKITRLKNGNAAVKTISQPFASFGGRQAETDNSLYTRASERLRHKNRCITAWDYERVILQAFPEVHKVKCIPHARFLPEQNKYCWLAPGNVVIIVIPDLRNKNAVDRLAPKVNSDTISRITSLLQAYDGMQVGVKVKNPAYQQVMLDFRVKFRTGYEYNFYSEKLKEQITQFLSPWAFASGKDITFGGKIYKSVLLDFVEEVEYVDYVEDFYMYSISESSGQSGDLNELQPETPDTILVSYETHTIHEVT